MGLLLSLGALGSGVAGIVAVVLLQQPDGPLVSPGVLQAVIGFLLVLCGYLFKASRDHDRLGAALDERSKRNRQEIDQLIAEARTVDSRIEASRHLMRNVVAEVVTTSQERTDARLSNVERKMDTLIGLDAKLDGLLKLMTPPPRTR